MADIPFAFIRDMMAAALGVEAHLLRPPYKDAQEFDYRLSRILRADFDYKDIFSASAMHGLEEGTVYYVHNTLELNYVFMPVPGPKPRSVLLFGPFLYEAASGPFFERVLAQNRIGKGDAAALRTFYGTVPEVAEPTMAAAAHAVACQLYGAHDPARVVHRTLASTVTGRAQPDEAFQFSMELLERRYRDENALLAAVSRGDYDAAVRHLGRFSIKNFTPRTGELLRDVKNMLIVVNTLLRKAAESGGVHPVYIDQLSGALAVKIERVADTVEANRLGLEMLRRYCRLVRNDAHSGCSQAVQKTLSYISLHLSGELSLRSIAAALGFNATYLSAQFSRERGETLTAYIHTLRLQTARRLLDETDLPVAEVAARVGMVDVAYFSRLFKKNTAFRRCATARAPQKVRRQQHAFFISFPRAAEGGHAHLQNAGRGAAGLCGIRAAGRAQPLLRLHRRGVRHGQLLARGRAPRRQPLSGHAAGRAGGDPVLLAVHKPALRPAGAPLPGPGPLLRHLHQSPVRRAQCHPARRRGVLCGDVHRHKGPIRLLYHRAHP